MTISQLKKNEPYPWALLLTADPSRALIADYLAISEVLCYYGEGKKPQGVLVWQRQCETTAEIMNLAVAEEVQGQGIGTALVCHLITSLREADGIKELRVKTGETSLQALALYQKVGFVVIARLADYFITHYPEPIYEDGVQLRDQLELQVALNESH